MKPIFQAAKKDPKRIIYAEGEEERVLRAVQVVVDEGLARPILIGQPTVVTQRLEAYGLKIRPGTDFEFVNPESDPRYRQCWTSTTGSPSARVFRSNTPKSDASAAHADRRDAGSSGRGGRHAVRDVRRARAAPRIPSPRWSVCVRGRGSTPR